MNGHYKIQKRTAAAPLPLPETARPRPKRWLFRLLVLTLIPLALLIFAEEALRVLQYGYPTSFFEKAKVGGRSVLTENKYFGWRFFPHEMARTPHPLVLEPKKPANAFRIFVFGESSAMGDPEPAFGLTRLLEVLLRDRYPGRQFEVVNAAMMAINSHVVLPIARDCATREGDLWVIYLGNNEVIGPFGAGTGFGSQIPSRIVIKANLALKSLKIGQALEEVRLRLAKEKTKPQLWEGMEMFLAQQVAAEDPRLQPVYSHFRQNLEEIIGLGLESGASVIVSTVASNLKDCAPFGSAHKSALGEDQKETWEKLYQEGIRAEAAGTFPEAIAFYKPAAELDDHFAGLQFRLGRCHWELKRYAEARVHYQLARDFDTLRFRADSEENGIIREVGRRRQGPKVFLVDAEAELAKQSLQEIVGDNLFYEHVHFNFQGNYLLALSLAQQAAQVLSETGSRSQWLSASECAERLAYSTWNQLAIAREIRRRRQAAPFTQQLDHAERDQRWAQRVSELQAALTPEALRQAIQVNREAVGRSGADWMLHDNLGKLLEATGDSAGALAEWRKVIEQIPHYPTAHFQIGNLLDLQGKSAEAQSYLETAVRLKPDFVGAINSLGLALAGQGKSEEAFAHYARALQIKPDFAAAHVNWGLGLAAMQRLGEAESHFLEALRINPDDAFAHFNLGSVLVAEKQFGEAASHFARAVELKGDFTKARFSLATELARLGKPEEARSQLLEAVRLQPNFLEAHLTLGVSFFEESKATEARHHFQEVLRLSPTNAVAQQYLARLAGGKPPR